MSKRTKRDEYEICLERGHQSDATLTSDPPQFRCKWCGTIYVYQSVLAETNVPIPTFEPEA